VPRSVVRVENLSDVAEHIPEVLRRIKKEYLQRHYKIVDWKDHYDFLTQIAKKSGKLLKNNVPDIQTVAKRLLYDWQRGKIPWYTAPPSSKDFVPEVKEEKFIEIIQDLKSIQVKDDLRFNRNDKLGFEVQLNENNKIEKDIENLMDFDQVVLSMIIKDQELEKLKKAKKEEDNEEENNEEDDENKNNENEINNEEIDDSLNLNDDSFDDQNNENEIKKMK